MVEKNTDETIEFFTPHLGLDLNAYIESNHKQGIHHIARYIWATKVLSTLPPGRVLDIACGAGYGSLLLGQALPDFTIVGGDYDPRAVAYAKKHYGKKVGPNVTWRQIDVVTWRDIVKDKPIGAFDYIISFDTIEHLLHREIAFINFSENLSKDGVLLFSTPCGRSSNVLNPGWEHHKIEYSYRYLYNLLSRLFEEVRIPDNGTLPDMDFWDEVVNKDQQRYFNRNNPIMCQRPISIGLDWPPRNRSDTGKVE